MSKGKRKKRRNKLQRPSKSKSKESQKAKIRDISKKTKADNSPQLKKVSRKGIIWGGLISVILGTTSIIGFSGLSTSKQEENISHTVQDQLNSQNSPPSFKGVSTLENLVKAEGFAEISRYQFRLKPSQYEHIKKKAMAWLKKSDPTAQFISVEPYLRRDVVYFAPNNKILQDYIVKQQELITKLKQYLDLDKKITLIPAKNEADLKQSEGNIFYAVVVAYRKHHNSYQINFLDHLIEKKTLFEDQTPFPASETKIKNTFAIEGDSLIYQPPKVLVIISPHYIPGIPLDVSCSAEYLHLCSNKRNATDIMNLVTKKQIQEGRFPLRSEPSWLDEGVIHGTLLAALEDLGELTPFQSKNYLRRWKLTSKRYHRVNEFYTKARIEGVKKVWDSYMEGLYSKF